TVPEHNGIGGGWHPRMRTSGRRRDSPPAAVRVVVDHARGLHEGVADGGANEAEAALRQRLAHRLRLVCLGGHVSHRTPVVHLRFAAYEGPEELAEGLAASLHREVGARVADGRVDLRAVAN